MTKFNFKSAILFSTALALSACSINNLLGRNDSAPQTVSKIATRDGEMVVKFRSGATDADVKSILGNYKTSSVVDAEARIFLVKDTKLSRNETTTAEALESNQAVEFAEPNFVVTAGQMTQPPQDPMWLSLWGMKNYGQDAPNGVEGVEGADIGAMDAWGTTTGSKDIVVAVLDTGVDYTHPDLAENMWVNVKEKNGVPGVDDDGNGYVDDIHGFDFVSDGRNEPWYGQVGDPDPMDDNSHGTHVSGTIGARGGNGIGVVGVNWNVSIMAVKFLDANGSGSSVDEYRALKYIVANKPDVVNGSYGGGAPSKLIMSILDDARAKGITFCFAAGNDSKDIDLEPQFPAAYPQDNIISVAATDSRDQIASFSNYGRTNVDIAAPGENIMSTIPLKKAKAGGPYAVFSGTSMATPHVTGAVALLLAADPSLRWKPAMIAQRLMTTVQFKSNLAALVGSAGRLNIANAIGNVTTQNPALGGQWMSLPMSIATPAYAHEKLDNAWKINVPGAKAIRVHIAFAEVEDGFDEARLFDSDYRQVMNLKNHLSNEWSPVMLGETAYLKFSNALVSIDGGEPFANFNSGGVQIDRVEYMK